ncbi:nuclease-related domain-containing protein [Virgibacillus sp. DJP39]|uniref:nuclease-related domain-containing protein n=1 Tax=Virgibacillus sp. DJP39 TaxID=3409790 RepID=UPI003BB4C2F2
MIIKKRKPPIEIHVLEALIRRLPPGQNKLQAELAKSNKGFKGEKTVDRFTATLPQNNFTILHDLFLHNKSSSFQIDTLIISPHCIYVVEIKNFVGTVTFDLIVNQLTREHNGHVSGFRNPMIQATTNRHLLTEWLSEHNIVDIPIHPIVAISEPSTIIRVKPAERDISESVMHGEYMPQQIMKMEHALEGKRHAYLHQKIGTLLIAEEGTFNFDYQKKYGIQPGEIMNGVQCPRCGLIGMERKQKSWHCTACGEKDKKAYLTALSDYFILVKPWITNSECMKYLQVNSRHIVTRLLKSSDLTYDEQNKSWKPQRTRQPIQISS